MLFYIEHDSLYEALSMWRALCSSRYSLTKNQRLDQMLRHKPISDWPGDWIPISLGGRYA